MNYRRAFSALACASALLAAGMASAQVPRGADSLSAQAVSESLAVLASLDKIVRARPTDAGAWYRRGMIAWALQIRDSERPPISGLDGTRLGRLADTSLRIAKQLAPDSSRYLIAAGQYMLSTGWGVSRQVSRWMFGDAILAARKSLSPEEHAEAALELGRDHWRRYDSRAHRQLELDPGATPRSLSEAVAPVVRAADALLGADGQGGSTDPSGKNSSSFEAHHLPDMGHALKAITSGNVTTLPDFYAVGSPEQRADIGGAPQQGFKDAIETFEHMTQPLPSDVQGEGDYLQAETLFREAYEASPRNARVWRNLAMVLVDKNRWTELANLSRARTVLLPWDAWGWMALGLATHRLGDEVTAAAAFDSAMTWLSPDEHARLDQLERILPPNDSARVAAMTGAERAAYQRLYWIVASPLWSQQQAQPRVEYLARVAYAEFRWTVEELKVRGADSDRGNVHIRYGPPDRIFTIAPDAAHQVSDVTTIWIYNSGLLFVFVGPPAWGTARVPYNDRAMVDALTEAQPIRWDNINSAHIEAMPFQTARFRAPNDSVDVIVAALAPVARIRKAAEVAGPITTYLWWLGSGALAAARDSAPSTENAANVFVHRIAPGAYLMRTEASAAAAPYAGAATTVLTAGADSVTGFTMSGFGMSDVLVATTTGTPPVAPRRWNDIPVTPVAGAHSRSAPISLVWETYGLAARDNQMRDSVTITIERTAGNSGRVVAEIVGRLAGAVGINRANDRVVVRLAHSRPAAEITVEQLGVSLAGTPAGTYTLTVSVLDLNSRKTTSRTTRLVLVE